jgi:hypothetical protein
VVVACNEENSKKVLSEHSQETTKCDGHDEDNMGDEEKFKHDVPDGLN